LLAGRAAESVFYGDEFVSVGATEDLRQVNILARRMINQFGMGEQIENYHDAYTNDDNPFLGRTMGVAHHVSDELASSVDKEVLLLVKDAYQETKKILKERETFLRTIMNGLLTRHTLYDHDIRELMT
jgi:cell division protease FtsH